MKYNSNNEIVKIAPKKASIVGFIQLLLAALIVFVLIFTFAFRLVTVDGSSMKETLINGDKLVVGELFQKPEPNDIVVANCNDSLGKVIIKRVIATEGQTLKIDYENEKIVVDGVVIEEPYISSKTNEPTDYWEIPKVVPEGYVFVMGDNRSYSLDSRDNRVQMIPVNNIVGKAELVVFPFDRVKFLN